MAERQMARGCAGTRI